MLAGALLISNPKTNAKTQDVFVHSQEIPPKGTSDPMTLLWAPNPQVTVAGQQHFATIVVDLKNNILYKYDQNGKATEAYLVASGASKTPSTPGLKAVSHIESYPYKSAASTTKRYKKPNDYGPRIICLETVDPTNNERGITGEFIHGNNNPASLGKHASKGCIRMDNEVIKKLAKEVKRGDFVLVL